MKVVKVFLITLFAFLLSGCYTQLQYSQKMNKIIDEEEGKAYAWTDEKEQEAVKDSTDQEVANIPLYYKDYEYEEKYKDCACNPHNVYNFYGNDWFGYDQYDPYYSVKSYLAFRYSYFSPWHHPRHWYHYDPRFSFSFTFGWGSSYYHHFYDPFFDPFFDFYWYGSRYPWYAYRYNNYYRYGNFRYIYDRDIASQNVRYGPRSIGTNRVVTNGNRSRNVSSSTRSSVRTESNVRSRSVGTTRTRSNTDRNTGSTLRTRSRTSSDNSKGTTRSRSRDNNQSRSDLRYPVYIDRIDEPQRPVIINESRLRSRTINLNNISRNREVVSEQYLRNRLQPLQSDRPSIEARSSFLKRMKNFLKDNSSRIINSDRLRSNSRTVRSRSRSSSSSSKSSVSRSSSRSRSSSVSRSRSSSSSSKSRGSSSRSRSGGGSSGSDRSRDN